MKIAVTGASGLIGSALVPHLRREGHEVVKLVRREPAGADEAYWDPAGGSVDPVAMDGLDAAVHLAGVGVGDRRWTEGYKRSILESRVQGTGTIARAMAALRPAPHVLVSASAIGVYADGGDAELTEQSPHGDTFLAGVVEQWEAAADPAREAGIQVAHPRTGLVMAKGGGAFGKTLPLFKLGLGGKVGNGRQWWSWITLRDEVRALTHLLSADVAGPVNLTGAAPERNATLTRALGRALGRPTPAPVPAAVLKVALGEFAGEVLASQRVVPQALQRSGFTFEHADADAACHWLAQQ